jgi:hypothetical protein
LIGTVVMAAVYLGLMVTMLVLRVWPAAVLFAVFVVGWSTRVFLTIKLRSTGLKGAAADRYATTLFAVQLPCWLLAAVYFLVTRFWLGLFVALMLAGANFGYGRLVKNRERPIDA